MREDTRRALERALLMQKLKWAGAALAAATVMAGVFWFEDLSARQEIHPVKGVVTQVGPLRGKTSVTAAQKAVGVDVKLDDGRITYVIAPIEQEPKVGDHIEIAEHVSAMGQHSFSWR